MSIDFRRTRLPRLRTQLTMAVVATAALLFASVAVSAAQGQSVDLGLILQRAAAGSQTEIARVDVDPSLVGRDCILTASIYNQRSVNAGNDVIVSTGGTQLLLSDVESARDITTSATTAVVAGDHVVFTLVMGSEEIASLAPSFSLDCPPAPSTTTTTTTTTTTSTTTTTTVASATEPSTTTTTTTTVPTKVENQVVAAQPATPVQSQPTFTG